MEAKVRATVLLVAGLNLGYFFIELAVALAIGSVSLFADSVDFLEDTAINLLIFAALGWTLHRRAVAGKAMAVIILVPALAAAWQAVAKFSAPAAAFLSARNDVLVNAAIIMMGLLTAWLESGWPDIVLGLIIVALNAGAAREVWETAEEERLAAKALAGEKID